MRQVTSKPLNVMDTCEMKYADNLTCMSRNYSILILYFSIGHSICLSLFSDFLFKNEKVVSQATGQAYLQVVQNQ